MIDDINTKRTELANQMAAAGAAALDFNATAAVLAAIPDTEPQQYVAAGTPENIAAILPATICPQRRMRHGERPTEALVFDEPAATSGDASANLQQLKALALAFQNENGEHWYNYLQLADGISYESAADFMVKVSPAVVLDLIARIERAAAPAPTYWNAQRKIIERAIIGLRDGWASRKDADDALQALAASPATASGDELESFGNYFAGTLSCDDSENADLISACRSAAHDAWMERARRAAVSAATKPDSDLRTAVRDMTVMLANGEWGNPVYSDADTEALSAEIADLVGQASAAATKPTADLSSFDADHFKQLLRDVSNESYFCGINLDNDEAYAGHLALAEAADKAIIDYVQSILATMLAAAPSPQVAEELPPLPEKDVHAGDEAFGDNVSAFSGAAMQQYARDAIVASSRAAGGMSIEIKHAPAGKTDFARGEILGYEGSPTRFMVVGEDDLYLHAFILGAGMYWGVRKEEPNLACLVRYSAAQPAESAGQAGQVARAAKEGERHTRIYLAGKEAGLAERAAAPAELTVAARDVLAERRRQVEQEGWTSEHDSQYEEGELSRAAACYALAGDEPHGRSPNDWPWDESWWKPRDDRANLVRAGALILADIERLDRATHQPSAQVKP